jgi:hypothetical protein
MCPLHLEKPSDARTDFRDFMILVPDIGKVGGKPETKRCFA